MNKVARDQAKIIYDKTHSYAKTARVLGVTRQRIHQIINNYITMTHKNRFNLYKKIYFLHNPMLCFICKKNKFTEMHHIDKNCHNNSLDNLLPVCKLCHMNFHTK